MPVAEMDQRKIECAETPFRHDFDKPAIAHQTGLHHRRKFADADARDQRRRESGIIVHRKKRLEAERFLVLVSGVHEMPPVLRVPMGGRQQPVLRKILRGLGMPMLFQIGAVRLDDPGKNHQRVQVRHHHPIFGNLIPVLTA